MSSRGLRCQKQYGKFTDRSTIPFIFPCDDDTRHAAFASSLRISKTKELTNLPKHQCIRGNQAGVCVCVCSCVLAGSRYSQLPHHKTRGSTPVRVRLFSETLNPHMRGVCVARGKIYDWNINSTSETETEDFTSRCTSLEKKQIQDVH